MKLSADQGHWPLVPLRPSSVNYDVQGSS